MAMLPTLSVVIPCYNGLPFVVDAVQSVIDQLDEGIDCIVVDDGSTDGSADLLERQCGRLVTVVRHPHLGISKTRNRGLAESNADLITWLDADDLLTPKSLEIRRRMFAAQPRLEMLVGQYEVFEDERGGGAVFPQPPCDASYLESLLFRRNLPHLDAITFRRSSVRRVGAFNPAFGTAEDCDLWIRAWVWLEWRFLARQLARVRTGRYPSATRRLGKVGLYADQGKVLRANRAALERAGKRGLWRRAYAFWMADYARLFLTLGRPRDARRWALRAATRIRSGAVIMSLKYAAEATLPGTYAALRGARRELHL